LFNFLSKILATNHSFQMRNFFLSIRILLPLLLCYPGFVFANTVGTNTAPSFISSSPQALSVCQNGGATNIISLLHINDPDISQIETWSQAAAPTHGTLSFTSATASSGSTNITPGGTITYTPSASYSGSDQFTIQVSDGTALANMVVNVTVNPTPVASFTAQPGANACASTDVTYTTQASKTNYVWGFSGTAGVDYAISSGGTSGTNNTTVMYYTVGPQTVTVSYTDGNGCVGTSATASTPTTIKLAPAITSISPITGIPGNLLTITGTDFNPSVANNLVYFGSVAATVNSASSTALTVTIPKNSVFNPTINSTNTFCYLTGTSATPFLARYNNASFVSNTINFDPKVNFTIGSSANRIGYGDIDGDGKTDIIVNNSGTGTVSVYRNMSSSGTVSFASAVVVATGISFPGQPSVGDLDGDGKPELVFMGATGPPAVYVYRNTSSIGSISFGSPLIINYQTNANVSTLADIDGDGRLDIVGSYLTNLSVFRNISVIGSLSFANRVNYTVPASINFIAAGDLNGDKKPDLLVSMNGGTTSLSVFKNTSIPGTISMGTRLDFTTPTGSGNYVALADLDSDGKQEVLTINQGASSFSLFPNISSGGAINLGTRQDYSIGANPSGLFIADFDGDGKPDVAATSISTGTVSVFRNTSSLGSYTFATAIPFATGSGGASIMAGDIDGDGKSDMVVLNQSTTTMSVFRNNPLQPIIGATNVCIGNTTTLTNAFPGGTWTSSNTSVATVGASTGIVNASSPGTTTITYSGSASSANAGNQATQTITVNALPTLSAASVCLNNSINMTGSGTPGTTNPYVSSATGIATISSSGTVTPVSAGSSTITYTNNNGCQTTATLTVNALPTLASASVCQEKTITMTGSGTPGSNPYASANTGVASVSSAGLVTPASAGTTYIIYTDNNGCQAVATLTVTSSVTVNAVVSPLYPLIGQEIQTIYLNYPGSAQADTITASISGGTPNYSYNWAKSNCNQSTLGTYSNTTNTAVFSPVISDICSGNNDNVYTYTVTVTDGNGCTGSASKRVNVVNPYVGTNVQVCHKVSVRGATSSQLLQVTPSQVAAHLAHGDGLGNCPPFMGKTVLSEIPEEVLVYPNPTTGVFIVELSRLTDQADIMITDVQGKLITHAVLLKDQAPTATFSLSSYAVGMYLIQVRDGAMVYRSKIVLR